MRSQIRQELFQSEISSINFLSPQEITMDTRAVDNLARPLSNNTFQVATYLIFIQKLPRDFTEETLRHILAWSKNLICVEILSEQPENPDLSSAFLSFNTHDAAVEAKNVLEKKINIRKDVQPQIEILLADSDIVLRNYSVKSVPVSKSSGSKFSTKLPGFFASYQVARNSAGCKSSWGVVPTNNVSTYPKSSDPTWKMPYHKNFMPQSPDGNQFDNRGIVLDKSLIKEDSVLDDDTGDLEDLVTCAKDGFSIPEYQQLSHCMTPPSQTAEIFLDASPNKTLAPMFDYSLPNVLQSRLSTSSTPQLFVNNRESHRSYQSGVQPHQRLKFPLINHSDHNPPCNTLYVGNLPTNTSEDELKTLFSKQRGYKRLCFRTKQNGPMCFVEFEDISFATKALHELYGQPLHNSTKGGIRLSFSKNPLGVRSANSTANHASQNVTGALPCRKGLFMNGPNPFFYTAGNPPLSLIAPPGFESNYLGHTGTAIHMFPTINNHSFSKYVKNENRNNFFQFQQNNERLRGSNDNVSQIPCKYDGQINPKP